jgi:hypothetical protein
VGHYVLLVSPTIDLINITFVILQSWSLLITQQEEHINVLIGSLIAMFSIEIIEPNMEDDAAGDVEYVSVESMHVQVNAIVMHIQDQGSFASACYDHLNTDNQKVVVNTIVIYAMTLILGLMKVKAKHDGDNNSLDQDALPVLPVQLVKLRHSAIIWDVLNPDRDHIAIFWAPESIDQIEEEHRDLLKFYSSDPILRKAINKHDNNTSFDDAWDCAPGRFLHLYSFCGNLATVFANTTSVKSDFSILKWEMDDNRTALMHLLLEGIF